MLSESQERRVRQRAYELWERDGCPEGRSEAHWDQAVQEIRAEDGWVDDVADPAEPETRASGREAANDTGETQR